MKIKANQTKIKIQIHKHQTSLIKSSRLYMLRKKKNGCEQPVYTASFFSLELPTRQMASCLARIIFHSALFRMSLCRSWTSGSGSNK